MQEKRRFRPPLTLALGPAGVGKTEWALDRLCAGQGSAILIVTSAQQADTRAEQVAQRIRIAASEARSAILPFYSLVSEILQQEREGERTFIGRHFQRLVLDDLFYRSIRPDDFLGRMLSSPGFVPAFQERLREWKLAGVTPDALEAGAETAEVRSLLPFARKLNELARLYRAYEKFLLDHRLRDEEDGLRRAAYLIRQGIAPIPFQVRQILVDGFYRFTQAQRDLLAALAERGMDAGKAETAIAITLSYEEGRPLLFASPFRTLTTLRAEFETSEFILSLTKNTGTRNGNAQGLPASKRPSVLTHLSACLFAPTPSAGGSERAVSSEQEYSPSPAGKNRRIALDAAEANGNTSVPSPALQIFDAPNPYVEAEMVAREFRRLHDNSHNPWDDFAIILRTLGDYAPILSAVFERYDIPLGVDGPEQLSENPLLKTALHLLAVIRYGWQREDVLAFLKSSYTLPDKLAADRLRKRAQAKGVRSGRERWLELIEPGVEESRGLFRDDAVAHILREMARFDKLLTDENAETFHFVQIMKEMIAAFGMEERLLTGEKKRIECDKAALREGLAALDTLARMAVLRQRAMLSFAQFHDDLRNAWENASSIASCEGEYVRVTEPYDAHERPARVAAVMGLTERIFPRRITEDPFLRDEERRFLAEEASLTLEEQSGRADDERFLFYLAITAPSERLLLTFPRARQEADALPSFYLDEVRAVADVPIKQESSSAANGMDTSDPASLLTVSRTLADVAPRWEDAVVPGDRLLAACADLFDADADSDGGDRALEVRNAARRMQDCLEDRELDAWAGIVLASRRLPRLPTLIAPELRADFVGERKVYTPAELETYAKCPFQYLMRYVIKLRPESEGLDRGMQSALLHSVLRRYFRKRARQGTPATEATDEQVMRTELRGLLSAALDTECIDASPHHLRMVKRRLADDLDGFAQRETRFSPQFRMTAAYFHLSFGQEAKAIPPDPFSCAEPLWLKAADKGTEVAICGTIDRVDMDVTGQRALILEYEAGKPPEFSAIQRGESLQLPLYMLAMERVFGKIGAAACYDSMREGGRRRFHRAEHVNIKQFAPVIPLDDPSNVKPLSREQYEELTKTAEAAAIRTVRAIETARIDATAGDHCKTCAYRDVCRTSLAEGHDGEKLLRTIQ